jgi:biopolymer transport protein TolR
MGGKLGAGGGPMADINVTPLIDVVLVLLVVFMVITPMLSSGLPVDLPMATTTVQVNDVGQHIVISMTANGDWAVEQEIIEGEDTDMLIRMVQAEFNKNPERSILVKADRGLEYGAVRVLMDALAEHRFTAIFIAAGKEG